jgi:hypothetical protein
VSHKPFTDFVQIRYGSLSLIYVSLFTFSRTLNRLERTSFVILCATLLSAISRPVNVKDRRASIGNSENWLPFAFNSRRTTAVPDHRNLQPHQTNLLVRAKQKEGVCRVSVAEITRRSEQIDELINPDNQSKEVSLTGTSVQLDGLVSLLYLLH